MTVCTAAGSTGTESPTADQLLRRDHDLATRCGTGRLALDSSSWPAGRTTLSSGCARELPPGRARCPPRR